MDAFIAPYDVAEQYHCLLHALQLIHVARGPSLDVRI